MLWTDFAQKNKNADQETFVCFAICSMCCLTSLSNGHILKSLAKKPFITSEFDLAMRKCVHEEARFQTETFHPSNASILGILLPICEVEVLLCGV